MKLIQKMQALNKLKKIEQNENQCLKEYLTTNPLPKEKPFYPVIFQAPIQKKSEIYQELLNYLKFHDYTNKAIEELKEILRFDKSLEQTKVKQWVQNHLDFFNENLFPFGIDYLDSVDNDNENIYLQRVNEYVDKVPFLSIIKFWECMWLLYFDQYHLDIEKRSPPDPVGSYYYKAPDPTEPKDVDKVLNYLELA